MTTVRILVASLLLITVVSSPGDERPNIVLMMADDLGWGDPTYNGGWINTPTLDLMAASGLRFDRFYSASAVCSPTRGSCLTGRTPLRLGIPDANSGSLAADETPLPEVLDGIGYATGHFGKWHLGTLTTLRRDSNRGAPGSTAAYSPPWQHGYDHCFATEAKVPTFHPMRRTVNGLPEPLSFTDPNFYGTYYWTPPADPATWPSAAEGTPVDVGNNLSGDDSRAIMDRVIPFVRDAVATGDPFLTVIWFHTPHKPLPDPDGTTGVDGADAYTDAIVNMDMQIARLRGELDTLGVSDNTMFWFCSDNGPEDGVGRSGPYRGRKRSLHEGGVRVPSILIWPNKIPAGRVTDFPAVTSDYYPTILDYLCIEVPGQKPLDGISLRGVIENTATSREEAVGFSYRDSLSWVNQRYKLISKDGGTTFELYDLLADISENDNIASANPQIVARMSNELHTWQAAVAADEPYRAPSDTTTAVLSTMENPAGGELSVSIIFSEPVTGLSIEDFSITNGAATTLAGSGAAYSLSVLPETQGLVTVTLPAASVLDSNSNPNLASNTLHIISGIPSPAGRGEIVIDDHFDVGSTSAWISQGNARSATHNINAADSILVSEVIGESADTNRGIASVISFNPLDYGGFSSSFVVDRVAQEPELNGFFLGIVGDAGIFYRDSNTRNFGLTFFGIDSRTNSAGGFGLNFGDNFAAAGARLRLADGDAQLASFQDGFTATIQADRDGWAYEISGLDSPAGGATVLSNRGNWAEAGVTFDELFGTDTSWHAATSNQLASTGTHSASFDRIRLVAGAEPAPIILAIHPELSTGKLELRWESIEGRRYQIERSADLRAWTILARVTAGAPITTFTDTGADASHERHFYRIRPLLGGG